MRATITVRQRNQAVRSYSIDQPGQYLIGSDPACPIHVDLPGIAAQHARLTVRENTIQIEDLGSASGTFLDSARLGRVAAELAGQTIRLGDVQVEVQTEALTVVSPTHLPAVSADAVFMKSAKYDLGETVARGGMGAIWRARDRDLQRTVAVKVVLDEVVAREDLCQRFLQEARLTGQLEHPNIVPVHELAFDERGQPYYTMKLVKGHSLQEVLDQIKAGAAAALAEYSLAHLLTIFQKICDAVAFAHSKGIVHRDLKPANIMIGEYGEVLVMDWGLAKIVGRQSPPDNSPESGVPSPESRMSAEVGDQKSDVSAEVTGASVSGLKSQVSSPALTLAGSIMGSPQFMPPEQAAGQLDEIDARSDIFALGGILYNLLTLHPPISGNSIPEMLEKIRQGEILPPSSYHTKTGRKSGDMIKVGTRTFPRPPLVTLRQCPGGRIPEGLAAVAMKALALRREDRYQTVRDLQVEITAYQNGFTTSVEQAGPVRRFMFLVKRNKRAVWAAGLLTALFAVGFTIFLHSQLQKKRAQYAGFIQAARRHELQSGWNDAIDQMTRANVIFDTLEGRRKLLELLLRGAGDDIKQKSWGAAAIKVQRVLTLDPANSQGHSLLPLVLGEGFLSVTAGFPGELIEIFYNEDFQPVIDPQTQQPRQKKHGRLPIHRLKLPEGIHYFEVRKDGKRFCSLPMEIVRGHPRAVQFTLSEIPEGFEYIHEGEFIQGDDTTVQADGKVGRRRVFVPSFFMKRTPVTMNEYRLFYNSDSYEKILGAVLREHGLTFGDLVAGAKMARDVTPEHLGEEVQNPRPVFGVSYYEALAYAQWVGGKIPTSEQWEKAARGIDGRAFAGGNLTPAERPSDPSLLGLESPTTHEVTPFGCVGLTDTYWQWTASKESPRSVRLIVKGGTGTGPVLDRKPSRQKEMDPSLRYRTVTLIVCKDLSVPPDQAKGNDQ